MEFFEKQGIGVVRFEVRPASSWGEVHIWAVWDRNTNDWRAGTASTRREVVVKQANNLNNRGRYTEQEGER